MSEAIRQPAVPANDATTSPPRGRWLVVHDADTARLARDISGISVATTDNYLTALAALARQPVDVVIGPVSALDGMMETTASALRELAPQVRLIVTAHPHEQDKAHAAVAAGFDSFVMLPSAQTKAEQAPPLNGKRDQLHEESLGDVDLVNALLRRDGELPQLALRLARQHSGIAAMDLVQGKQPPPDGHASATVDCGDKIMGALHAPPPTTGAQLRPWADWLAKWLALYRRDDQLYDLSMRDELTGVWNRRYFNRFLKRILDWAARDRSQVTLMVFDIDNFKRYNDHYGHWAGDEILRESARLMKSVCREHDVVARIGGDEFAVIFWDAEAPRRPNSRHPQDVVRAAERFQAAICSHAFPKLLDQAPDTLTISGGLASYPWDGRSPQELLFRADEMAMESKRHGKNAITFGPGAARICHHDNA